MYKSTLQQIFLLIVSTFILAKAGKYLVELNDINSIIDFGVISIFFISTIIFLNCSLRLISKILGSLSF